MPYVSIIIPTRNRAKLLPFALRSALLQTFDDIEIIVSDNASTDDTQNVAGSFDDKRIRCVLAPKALSMPDSWEFALSQAKGEWIALLADDCFLFPHTISFALQELKKFRAYIVAWKFCIYFDPSWIEPARKNLVYIPKTSGKSFMVQSSKNIQKLYRIDEKVSDIMPKSLNTLIHRSLVEKIIKRQKRFFLPPCPDYTSAASIMLNTQEYLFIDKPLYIDGVTRSSIGASASFDLGPSSQDYIKEFTEGMQDVGFLGIPTSTSNIAKGLEEIKKIYGDACPDIDMPRLISSIADRLAKIESNGGEVEHYWRSLHSYVKKQPYRIQNMMKLRYIVSKNKWRLIRYIRFSQNLGWLESLRGIHILRGKRWGFNTIEECANTIATILPLASFIHL